MIYPCLQRNQGKPQKPRTRSTRLSRSPRTPYHHRAADPPNPERPVANRRKRRWEKPLIIREIPSRRKFPSPGGVKPRRMPHRPVRPVSATTKITLPANRQPPDRPMRSGRRPSHPINARTYPAWASSRPTTAMRLAATRRCRWLTSRTRRLPGLIRISRRKSTPNAKPSPTSSASI